MRKIALIITFFCLVFSIHAQKVQLGLKFNPNLSWFKIDNKTLVENDGVGIGFSYGLIVDYHFLENVALCIEPQHLFYSPSTTIKDSNNSNVIVNWKMQYIDIPISLKMMTNQRGKLKYFGKIGFSTCIKTSSQINDKNSNSVYALDFSMLIGGGIHYSLGGNTALLLGATFHNGFVSLNDDNTIYDQQIPGLTHFSLSGVSLKSQYISLDIGILF
jgi:hypothetical protein